MSSMPTAMALLGSGEFEPWAEPVDRWLLESSTNGSDRVLVLPTASAPEGDDVFDRWGHMGVAHYQAMGARPEVLPLKTRDDADRDDLAREVRGAAAVFFSGGNPGYLCRVLRDTAFWRATREAMAAGTSFGGCSAGACALGATAPDVASPDEIEWLEGLRVFERVMFGPHWDALDSYRPGLRRWIINAVPDGHTLVGIDERTAMTGGGRRWRVHGSGHVTIVAGGAERVFAPGSDFDLEVER